MPHPLSPHRFTYSRRLVRLLATLSLTAGLVAVPTAVSAQTGTPYCNSYVSPTSQYGAGDVKVGMLTSNTGEPNGAVGWLWNIYAPTSGPDCTVGKPTSTATRTSTAVPAVNLLSKIMKFTRPCSGSPPNE
jgi:hypothetical protein